MFDSAAVFASASAIIASLPILSRKYAEAIRAELRHTVRTAIESAEAEGEAIDGRTAVASALLDIVAMSPDCGGHYPPTVRRTADNGGLEWRAIYAEATRQLAGEFAAEAAEYRRAMAAIDAQFLTTGKP